MKKLSLILRKCKSVSKLGRSTSYSSLRSKSAREPGGDNPLWTDISSSGNAVVLVGSSKRRYLISSKHLNHPVVSSLISKSSSSSSSSSATAAGGDDNIAVNCEVVLFDHLLWMLDNADLDVGSLEELAELYVY